MPGQERIAAGVTAGIQRLCTLAAAVAARGSAGGAACVLERAASGTLAGPGSPVGPAASRATILSWRRRIFRAAQQPLHGSQDTRSARGHDAVHAAAGRLSNVVAPVFRAG